jgi:hypothetical protein
MLNWVCLAGAIDVRGRRPVWTEVIETYVLAANNAFAVFEAG